MIADASDRLSRAVNIASNAHAFLARWVALVSDLE
jgi:hypothetical protein